jgi:hippurate hydrolase
VDVFDPAVVTVAHMTAGTTTNVIAESAYLGGTMRTVSEATRLAVRGEVRRVADGIAAAHGASVQVDIEPGYPVTLNDADFTGMVVDEARSLLGDGRVSVMSAPIMGAEDFSYVLEKVPGAMAFLGARPDDLDPLTAPANHSNRVVFDESAMAVGVATHVAVALRHLAGPGAG